MADWSDGYMVQSDYTYGYYRELNPMQLEFPFLYAGLRPPKIKTACELGFGQGVSINIHAAASDIQWFGTDFNPSQARFAKDLANISGHSGHFFDDSFEEFFSRSDLPNFDFIALHGIWSWISEENRQFIVKFLKEKLNVGGVVYMGYNVLPGWAPLAPMRQLMAQHVQKYGMPGAKIDTRIDSAVEFAEQFLATDPKVKSQFVGLDTRIEKIKTQDRGYLAHEYFNADWEPQYFSQVHELLSSAKIDYACSANYIDHVDAINLTQAQQDLLANFEDIAFAETLRDFMIFQQFRRDYWVKGPKRLSPSEQVNKLREICIVLQTDLDNIKLEAKGYLGDASLAPNVYLPLLKSLERGKPISIAAVENKLSENDVSFAQILQAILLLAAKGDVSAVPKTEKWSKSVKTSTDRLNGYLIEDPSGHQINQLASPVLGAAVEISQLERLFLIAKKKGLKTTDEWTNLAWKMLNAQGTKLVKDGKTLQSDDENVTELSARAVAFAESRLKLLQSLKAV